MENNKIDYRELSYLKKCTTISLIAKLKIARELAIATKIRDLYFQVEGELLAVDTSVADALEYSYRYKEFQREIFPYWQKHCTGVSFDTFTNEFIVNDMNRNDRKIRL